MRSIYKKIANEELSSLMKVALSYRAFDDDDAPCPNIIRDLYFKVMQPKTKSSGRDEFGDSLDNYLNE